MRFFFVFALLLGSASAALEVPFKLQNDFILVEVQAPRAAGKSLTFLVDSGAGRSVISLRLARRLKLPMGNAQRVHGVEAEAEAFEVHGFRANLGRAELNPHVLALDLRNAEEICGRRIDGLLGVDFFAGRIIQIDYSRRCLRILERSLAEPASVILPLQVRNGALCVPVGVEGCEPRWTRLDSGCNDALHWVEPSRRSEINSTGISIGFSTDRSKSVRRQVALGGLAIFNVETALHGREIFPGEAGLLGNGLLSRFASVTIDLPQSRVLLYSTGIHKSRGFPAKRTSASW